MILEIALAPMEMRNDDGNAAMMMEMQANKQVASEQVQVNVKPMMDGINKYQMALATCPLTCMLKFVDNDGIEYNGIY